MSIVVLSRFYFGLFLICGILFSPHPLLAAGRGPRSLPLPAEALAVVEVRDLPAFMRSVEQSPLNRMYQDPRAANFFQPMREQMTNWRQRLSAKKGGPVDFAAFFNGSLHAVGLPAGAGSDSPMTWALVLQHNGDTQLAEQLKNRPAPHGYRWMREARSAGHVAYTHVRLEPLPTPSTGQITQLPDIPQRGQSDKKKDQQKSRKPKVKKLAYDEFVNDRLLIVAEDEGRPIEKILAGLNQPDSGKSWWEAPEYASLMNGAPEHAIRFYLNIPALVRWYDAQAAAGQGYFFMSGLKLGELIGLGGTIAVQPDRLAVNLGLWASELRQGISRVLFASAAAPGPTAQWIPADALSYIAGSYRFTEIWRTLREGAGVTFPAFLALLDGQLMQFQQNAGVNAEEAILGRLGPQLISFTQAPPAGVKGNPQTTLIVTLREPQTFGPALAKAITYFGQTFGFYLETADAGGAKINRVLQGRPDVGQPGDLLFAYGLTDQWLAASQSVQDLQMTMNRLRSTKADGLAGRKDFQAAMDKLPANRVAEGWASLPAWRPMLKDGLKILADQKKSGQDKAWLPVAASKVPPQEVLADYVGSAASARTIDGNQVRWTMLIELR